MKLLIAGASGLIGSALIKSLPESFQIKTLGRTHADYNWSEVNSTLLAQFDCVINLAGENVGAHRWSEAQKKSILNSRVRTTQQICEAAQALADKAPRLINASAMGIYGLNATANEESTLPNPPQDFLAIVGQAWEQALRPAMDAGIAVTYLRFGVVLAKQDGALSKMLPAFKLGLGGKIGNGQQAMSWVCIDDVVSAIQWLLMHPQYQGAFNVVAPEVVTQADFAKTLATVLHRPCIFPMPAFVARLLFGQMGEDLLLSGSRITSKRLVDLGFQFKYGSLSTALSHLLA